MKDANDRVILVSDSDMGWNWDDSHPTHYVKSPEASYGSHRKFDPFPCYTHNRDYILEQVKKVEKKFPIGFPTYYFIFPLEPIGRTNGMASQDSISYDENDRTQNTWNGIVELYGKRIPIMPAMSRYLVAHEYGHVVDSWINRCLHKGSNGLDKEYAKMRGVDYNLKYGGRNWHTEIGEIIANDFRIAVCEIEPEFWPHPCPHPNEDVKVRDWWYEAMLKYSV